MLLTCLLFAGCFISSNKTYSYADELFVSSSASPADLVGFYEFNSLCSLEDGDLVLAVVGDEWDDRILTNYFASVLVNEDGSFVCLGEVCGRGSWCVNEDGVLLGSASLCMGEATMFVDDARGLLLLEVSQNEGTSLSLCFAR